MDLSKLISEANWEKIIANYKPSEILDNLSFQEAMIIAYRMLYDKRWEDDFQNYAVDLLYAIRKKYDIEWNSSWKNDVFLGDACEIALRYDERYAAYKRASEQVTPIPPFLLVLLAGCYIAPGIRPISLDEAEELLKGALNIDPTIEAVILIRGICKQKREMKLFDYWDTVLKDLEKKGKHMKHAQPDFFANVKI